MSFSISGKNSYVYYMEVHPAGKFTRIFIHTRTENGTSKRIGGDHWRVYLKGPSHISATVFDHQNGTYEAMALVLEPGKYVVEATLDYSLCDGIKDPPEDWFRIGERFCYTHAKTSATELLQPVAASCLIQE